MELGQRHRPSPVLPPRRYHTPCARNGRIGKRLSRHSLRVAHTQTVLSGHRWLGAVLGDCAFSISVRHKLKNALMMIGTIGPLELAGLAATYASTCRTRSVSVELARHRWKAVLTGYGASSSGCATAEIYWDIPNTKPRFQISGAFVYSW